MRPRRAHCGRLRGGKHINMTRIPDKLISPGLKDQVLRSSEDESEWGDSPAIAVSVDQNILINGGFDHAQDFDVDNTLATENGLADEAYGPDQW